VHDGIPPPLWTLCERQVPADAPVQPEPGDRVNCARCLRLAAMKPGRENNVIPIGQPAP
jgi:hypothetical protein